MTSTDKSPVNHTGASLQRHNPPTPQQGGKESSSTVKTLTSGGQRADVSTAVVDSASLSIQTISQTVSLQQDDKQGSNPSPRHNNLASPKSQPPSTVLFFLHGVGGSSDVWQAQLRHFAREGYEIVAPDLIGHGMSCTPHNAKAYHFVESAADMEEIFDRYCKKRNIVIGHSYG